MKKILLILSVIVFAFACNNTSQKTSQETEETIIKVAFADFENSAANLINKKIEISAIVNHVCKHGGQKLFLVEGETEESIKVISGENLAAFNTDLEGNSIKVVGVVEELRIDETYLREWEAEIAAEIKHAEEEGDDHGHSEKGKEADLGEHVSSKESIANFRKEIAESGTDHLSFYSIICEKYEVITPNGN